MSNNTTVTDFNQKYFNSQEYLTPQIDLNDSANIDQNFTENMHDLKENFGFIVPLERRKLPHIYWLLNLHKNPIKFGMIIAATNLWQKVVL